MTLHKVSPLIINSFFSADDIILCGNEVKRRSDLIKRGSTFDGHQLTATEIKNLKSQIDQFKTAQTNLLNEIDTLNPLIDKLQLSLSKEESHHHSIKLQLKEHLQTCKPSVKPSLEKLKNT